MAMRGVSDTAVQAHVCLTPVTAPWLQGFVPPILSSAKVLEKFQLERVGYFW